MVGSNSIKLKFGRMLALSSFDLGLTMEFSAFGHRNLGFTSRIIVPCPRENITTYPKDRHPHKNIKQSLLSSNPLSLNQTSPMSSAPHHPIKGPKTIRQPYPSGGIRRQETFTWAVQVSGKHHHTHHSVEKFLLCTNAWIRCIAARHLKILLMIDLS